MSEKNEYRSIVKRVAYLVALFLVVVTGSVAFWFYSYINSAAQPVVNHSSHVVITIPPGTHFVKIQKILAEAGLINDDLRFYPLARMIGVSHRIQAGEFRLTTEQKPADLLRELVAARAVQHAITIPEGLNVEEIATIFASGNWCDYQRFVDLARDPAFITVLDFPNISSLEGYLFPDTYHLDRSVYGADNILKMLTKRFLNVWHGFESEEWFQLPLSREKLVTVASLVEKEAAVASEQPVIAGVFMNRIEKRMKLQSDPTVLYGLKDHQGPITRTDLRRATPYNTYVIKGLPVGPICNPGKGALLAVLRPKQHQLFYFVANKDGTHTFSKNLQAHNRAVRKYRKSLKSQTQ